MADLAYYRGVDQFYTNLCFPRPIALRKFFEYYEVIIYGQYILFTVGMIKSNKAHKALLEIFKSNPIAFDHFIIILKNEPLVLILLIFFNNSTINIEIVSKECLLNYTLQKLIRSLFTDTDI